MFCFVAGTMSIHLITGAMYAGKTTALMNMYKKTNEHERIMIKHKDDTRYGNDNVVFSHDGSNVGATVLSSLLNLEISDERYASLKLIAVDEGQFFEDIDKQAIQWALHGKHVIITGVCRDLFLTPIPTISRLIAQADDVTFLTAVCNHCRGNAGFSYRVTALPNTTNTVLKYVGGIDDYISLCRTCFYKRLGNDLKYKAGMFCDRDLRDKAEQLLQNVQLELPFDIPYVYCSTVHEHFKSLYNWFHKLMLI